MGEQQVKEQTGKKIGTRPRLKCGRVGTLPADLPGLSLRIIFMYVIIVLQGQLCCIRDN